MGEDKREKIEQLTRDLYSCLGNLEWSIYEQKRAAASIDAQKAKEAERVARANIDDKLTELVSVATEEE